MNDIFLKIINMTIAASWLVLAVLAVRIALKKAPKWIRILLWGIVAVRLICPFSVESALSLIPSAETVPLDIERVRTPAIDSGINAINSVINPVISASFTPKPVTSANPLQVWIPLASILWLLGMTMLLFYTAISYWRLHRKVDTAVCFKDNIFKSENVSSPFVFGIFRPRIYLPFRLDDQALKHVIAHEQAHISRKDHWWKPLGFILLAIHWFNPLMWLAYVLMCRDIELACDEKVIRDLGNAQRADYTQALVACSTNRRMIAACPFAFGEIGVKDRVRSVMNYRKPAFWLIVLAVFACAIVAVCFLTNPVTGNSVVILPDRSADAAVRWFDYLESPDEMQWDGRLEINLPEYPGVTFRWYPGKIEAITENGINPLYSGMPIWNTYFCDLTSDGLPDLCSTYTFGSGIVDSRIIIYDYANGASYEMSDRGYHDFILRYNEEDGYLYVDKMKYNRDELVESGRLVFKDDCLLIEGFYKALYEPTPLEQIEEKYDNEEFVITRLHYENMEGKWVCGGYTYKYRLEITGRTNHAAKNTTYIVLSNTEDITFEQTWKASGFSSSMADYFDPAMAVIVGDKLFN